jgi:tRNA-splicing ligase RtcB
MDTNAILRQAGYQYRDNFPEIARRAAELAQEYASPETVLQQIAFEFGEVSFLQMENSPASFAQFGTLGVHYDYDVIRQMNTAARLPVFEAGALMPDAHRGYALPIGGVAALRNAVSPNMVGVDIACRMAMTILEQSPTSVMNRREELFAALRKVTHFGPGEPPFERQHPVMDDPLWDALPHLSALKATAQEQLGTSGGGNHFADLMVGEVKAKTDWLPLAPGDRFAALLTHSGSRYVGYQTAKHYHEVAVEHTRRVARGIPKDYVWLSTDSEEGQEYLRVMRLMGRYAQANHHLIHAHFLVETGLSAWGVEGTVVDIPGISEFSLIENHHNFAWVQGNGPSDNTVIHRKGATPAHKGQAGLIPGSSGTKSYLVEGLGNPESLESCSHGAGRPYSRSEAKRRYDDGFFEEWMQDNNILYAGVAPDETLLAYKDIDEVMKPQEDVVVQTIAEMHPVAVVMGG